MEKVVDEMEKSVFEKGMRIEAVNVNGVDAGVRGVVKYVLENGNLDVEWQNGDETQVKVSQGEEVVPVKESVTCILRLNRGKRRGECESDCGRCGWNPRIERARRMAIHAGDLRDTGGGIRRLVLNQDGLAAQQ